jgi:hypothetical protein
VGLHRRDHRYRAWGSDRSLPLPPNRRRERELLASYQSEDESTTAASIPRSRTPSYSPQTEPGDGAAAAAGPSERNP